MPGQSPFAGAGPRTISQNVLDQQREGTMNAARQN